MKRVFLSFASEDYDFVSVLLTRLKRLGIYVWDYSYRNEQIPLGRLLSEEIAKRITEADYFLAIVTKSSVCSHKQLVHFEVSFALASPQKCIPVLVAGREPGDWEGAFAALKGHMRFWMSFSENELSEPNICELCTHLQVEYVPDIVDNLRLPLYENLKRELSVLRSVFSELKKPFVVERLYGYINKINMLYTAGDWRGSLEAIVRLQTFVNQEMGEFPFYFPQIVKGVCELQLNLLREAEASFLAAKEYKQVDLNAFGGLGHVYHKQGRYNDAFDMYEIALSLCAVNQRVEVLYNMILTAVQVLSVSQGNATRGGLYHRAMAILNSAEYISVLEDFDNHTPSDVFRFKYLMALAHFKTGNLQKSLLLFSEIYYAVIFTIDDAKLASCLMVNSISVELRESFRKRGFTISCDAGLSQMNDVSTDGRYVKRWVIVDEEAVYILDVQDKGMDICYCEISLIINFASLLEAIQQPMDALELFRTGINYCNAEILFHGYGSLLYRIGCFDLARRTYIDHLMYKPYDKQYLIELALINLKTGDRQDAVRLCNWALNSGMPQTAREFYYQGFACFLLGMYERAKGYYEDSSSYSTYYNLVYD